MLRRWWAEFLPPPTLPTLTYTYLIEAIMNDQSIEATLAERGARYGDFTDHAIIAQALQDTIRAYPGWGELSSNQRQALTVIADKIARILNGDPNYRDNWHDIAGYAKLAEDRCAGSPT